MFSVDLIYVVGIKSTLNNLNEHDIVALGLGIIPP